jgi:hypothetical protein
MTSEWHALKIEALGRRYGGRRGSSLKAAMVNRTLISIVDDDQPFRESMRKLVTLLGYIVEEFPSAADFLASPLLPETGCLIAESTCLE